LELVLTFPLIIFIILFLIGLGHTLITKQHSLVAARYTSQRHLLKKSPPSSNELARVVSANQGRWNISVSKSDSRSESADSLSGDTSGVLGSVFSFFSGLVSSLLPNNMQVVRVSTRPEKGLLPRIFQLREAEAVYVVEHETWTCEGNRGSYLSIVSSEISSRASSVPLLGYVTRLIDDVVSGIPCCETYQNPDAK
jgi:hypothetical protein